MSRLALALALAFVGTASAPDVPGVPDHDAPALDFTGAWFESAPDGVAFTVRVRAAHEPPAQHGYYVAFELRGARYVALVAFDADGRARSYVGPPNFGAAGVPEPARMSNALADEELLPGEPAHVRARIPWHALGKPGLEPGVVLEDLYAGTALHHDGFWDDEDGRQTTNRYAVEDTRLPLWAQRNTTPLLLGAAASVALLAGLGWLWWRRARQRF